MAVQGSDYLVIERGGTVYHVLASDILAFVAANLGSAQFRVADITARNALANLSAGDSVLVDDASADATVNTGWALYQWLSAGVWRKIAEAESLDVTVGGATNLSYTAQATQGIVVSDTGTDAVVPAANGTNAGLMLPAQHDKLAHVSVTAATDLDAMRGASHAAVSLAGTVNTNPLTRTGQVLGFSISQLTAAP